MTVETCCDLVKREFPTIDDDLYQYVKGVLETSSDEFESSEEVFEAVGGILQEVDMSKEEDQIRDICEQMMLMMKPANGSTNGTSSGTGNRILDAPVSLGSLGGGRNADVGLDSIWLNTKDQELKTVDMKKLERASELQLKKQERKDAGGGAENKVKYKSSEATASQIINKSYEDTSSAGANTKDIKIESFDISYGEKSLIQGANVTLAYGRRYGFVGRNGLGKSTLLRMIASRQLVIPAHLTVLHVEQEVTGDDTIALQSVLESWTVRENLLKEEKDLNAKMANGESSEAQSQRLQAVYAELEAIESDKAASRAAVILSGLGFTPDMQARATKTFSGGWRMRLALARALFCKPDLLLLDEPTNMLDMQAIIWLEKYLQSWASTILVVSHDRSFLDQVPTDILHIHSQRIDTYRGNYAEFVNTMTEKLKAQQREYESQMEYRNHIQQFIDKFRFNAKRASLVQSRIKQLERLPELKPVEKETEVTLKFPDVEKLSPPILMLSEVSFAYTNDKGERGPTVFSKVDLSATLDSRICIVGENGAGKTTLLKLIMDQNTPYAGQRTAHRNLKFGYFSQHHVDQLDMTVCPVELMAQHFPGHKSEEYRRMLGQFGVSGDLALQQIECLSGGQKSRVAFAILCGHAPNFLILDEPTNHLDVQTIEALGNAILKYKGGVILVSHDERLIRMVCKELWVCSKGKVYCLEGGFDEYREIVEKEVVVV